MKAELAIFRKQIFGSGKNEKQDKAQQLLLTLGQLEAKIAEVQTERVSFPERRIPGAPRQPPGEIFDKLPVRETIEIIPAQVRRRTRISTSGSEKKRPSRSISCIRSCTKRMIVRPKYSAPAGPEPATPIVAPALKRLRLWGATPRRELVSYVVLSKYAHHLPLYRQVVNAD